LGRFAVPKSIEASVGKSIGKFTYRGRSEVMSVHVENVPLNEDVAYAKVTRRLIPFLFCCYIVAYLDRVNVGFAKLQMQSDLKLSDTVYGIRNPWVLLLSLIYFCTLFPSNVSAAIVALSVATAGILSSFPLSWTMPTAMLAGSAAAAGIALINSIGGLAGFVSPYLVPTTP
jgi:hypothetical protein